MLNLTVFHPICIKKIKNSRFLISFKWLLPIFETDFLYMEEIIIILLLILLNGVFSMSEIALISARKSKLTSDVKKGSKTAKVALDFANNPERFLSTIQTGITLIGILTGIYSGDVLAKDFSEILISWGASAQYAYPVAQVFIIVVVTYLSIVMGELVPKRIGQKLADSVAKLVAIPIRVLSWIAFPFVWVLSHSTSLLMKVLGLAETESKVTEEEIKSIIQEGAEAGEVQEVEQDIMERVLVLGDLKVSSIMTHRKELSTLDINDTKEEIEKKIEEETYEAYPVVDGDLENVKGVVYLKDLAIKLGKPDFQLSSIVQEITYFPENMTVYKALTQMKDAQINRAFVCDEFGSIEGIITLKDIFEGLVGSIDEQDESPSIIKRKGKPGWLVDGQCPIYDFLSYLDREDLYTPSDYNTVGGLILEQLEHIPEVGETVKWQNFTFEVVDMDGIRIDKILVLEDEK